MKLAESFDVVELRDCIIRFLSSNVLSRNFNCSPVSTGEGHRESPGACLGFFLEIAGIDLLQLSFLVVASASGSAHVHVSIRTNRKKKVALLACKEACASSTAGVSVAF